MKKKSTKEVETKQTRFLAKHPLYNVWNKMKERCNNKNNKSYCYYGGRGIRVCDAWNVSYDAFEKDMKSTYKKGLHLDRVDNDGNYAPENCRWATAKENIRNRSNSLWLQYGNELKTLTDLAEENGLKYDTVWRRLKKGWSVHKALTTPVSDEVSRRSKSNKAAGRRLQQYVRDLIYEMFPDLEKGDVESQIIGVGGVDIVLSPKARKGFPFSVECKNAKNQKPSFFYAALAQAEKNCYENTTPCVVYHEPGTNMDTSVIMFKTKEFIKALNYYRRQQCQQD